MATANVFTLNVSKHDGELLSTEGLTALGRAQLLEKQFEAHGLDIICIQEGRTPDDQLRSGASYDMYIAGVESGQYGIQIRIRQALNLE
eukprot:5353628-Heterocapsa_arctica.AAC.1